MHSLKIAGGFDHIEHILVVLDKRFQSLLERFDVLDILQFHFRNTFVELRDRAECHAVLRLHLHNFAVRGCLVRHAVLKDRFAVQTGIGSDAGIRVMQEILYTDGFIKIT